MSSQLKKFMLASTGSMFLLAEVSYRLPRAQGSADVNPHLRRESEGYERERREELEGDRDREERELEKSIHAIGNMSLSPPFFNSLSSLSLPSAEVNPLRHCSRGMRYASWNSNGTEEDFCMSS